MAYRKVGYLEQCWYIIRYWLRDLFRRKKRSRAEETEETVLLSRLSKSDGWNLLRAAQKTCAAAVRPV